MQHLAHGVLAGGWAVRGRVRHHQGDADQVKSLVWNQQKMKLERFSEMRSREKALMHSLLIERL